MTPFYRPPAVPPFQGLHKSSKSQSVELPKKPPSFTHSSSTPNGLPPPVPQGNEDYVVEDINSKIARPEQYNEIGYKAADPMALRRKKKGGRSALARQQMSGATDNKPTGFKTSMVMNGPPPVPSAAPTHHKRMSAPSPFLQRKKSPQKAAPKKLSEMLEKRTCFEK